MSKKSTRRQRSIPSRGRGLDQDLTIDFNELEPPSNTFSATWLRISVENEVVSCCFGQHMDAIMVSRVDVRIGTSDLAAALRGSPGFYKDVNERFEKADPSEWEAVVDFPTNPEKYILEDASLVSLSYHGGQAELSFYMISPRDVLLARSSGLKRMRRQPRPVVAVYISARQLRWFIEESKKATGMVEEL